MAFSGDYHKLDDIGVNPLPVQQPIPVCFSGRSDAVLKRMAKFGDGWIPGAVPTEEVQDHLQKLYGYLKMEGYDSAELGIEPLILPHRFAEDGELAYLEESRRLSTAYVGIITMQAGITTVEQHIGALEKLFQR